MGSHASLWPRELGRWTSILPCSPPSWGYGLPCFGVAPRVGDMDWHPSVSLIYVDVCYVLRCFVFVVQLCIVAGYGRVVQTFEWCNCFCFVSFWGLMGKKWGVLGSLPSKNGFFLVRNGGMPGKNWVFFIKDLCLEFCVVVETHGWCFVIRFGVFFRKKQGVLGSVRTGAVFGCWVVLFW